ncbi:MAG TPA: tetratricopeptide repeat protein [candidate division Zixibacteria bacterium]|nr:tetratricopeptide repeat protein [candidate division Zixibacteria bacterium]
MIGKIIDDKYKILGMRGESPIANVYKAEDIQSGKIVALKVLKEEPAKNSELVNRLHQAVSQTKDLAKQRSIVAAKSSAGAAGGEKPVYIVMEFIDGPNLTEFVTSKDKNGLSDDEWHNIAQGVFKAIKDAHRNNVLHGGILYGDIFVEKNGRIKVADFGTCTFTLCENIKKVSLPTGPIFHPDPSNQTSFENFEKHFSEFLPKPNGNDSNRNWPVFEYKVLPEIRKYNRGKERPDQDREIEIKVWNGNTEGLGVLMLDVPSKPPVDWIKKIETINLNNIEDINKPAIIRIIIAPAARKGIEGSKILETELVLHSQNDPSSTDNPYPGEEKSISIKAEFVPEDQLPPGELEEKEEAVKKWKIPVFLGAGVAIIITVSILIFNPFNQSSKSSINQITEETSTISPLEHSDEELLNEARIAFNEKKWSMTIDKTSDALKLNSSLGEALYLRGWAYYETDQIKQAKNDFEKAVKLNQREVKYFAKYAWTLFELGKNEKAKKIMEQGLKLDPNNSELKNLKALIL